MAFRRNLAMTPLLSLAACNDQDLSKATFNAYFYFPDGKEELVAQVTGISACQNATREKARNLGLERERWSYVCCKKTNKSSCESKHK